MRFFRFFFSCAAAIFLIASPAGHAAVANPDTVFDRGNQAFESGAFGDAETAYRSLVADGFVSAELFYNLGDSLYRQNRRGEAALWYRRSLVLDPRFAEARQNLELVKRQTGYHQFELSGLNAWLARISSGELTAVLSFGVWIAILAIASIFLVRRAREWRPLLITTSVVAAALAATAVWGLIRQSKALDPDDLAIVTANDASAVASPVPDAEKVVDLPPGSELKIIQRAGPWTYVGIPQDIRGWVRTEAIAPVIWFGPHAAPAVSPGVAARF
ncbi:MAG: tetratricopeptide repeat protein [Verrucomicrobiae bacterium]|nr:tetratricopeptide repeat protein [Verrucomicrobiae bacterium]